MSENSISNPKKALRLMKTDPWEIRGCIDRFEINNTCLAALIYEYPERMKHYFPHFINWADTSIHEALLDHYGRNYDSKYWDMLKKSLLDFGGDEFENYGKRLRLYPPHIYGFRSWALENDLLLLCFENEIEEEDVLYLMVHYDLHFKDKSLTETARTILDRYAKTHINIKNSTLVRLATILSPNFILTSFIDAVMQDPEGDHVQAWNEALSKAIYLEWEVLPFCKLYDKRSSFSDAISKA